MKNATRVTLEPSTSISLLDARRATHLRHEGWSHGHKLAGFKSCAVELLALCYCLLQGFGFAAAAAPAAAAKYFFTFNV